MSLFKPPYTFLTTKPQKRRISKGHREWLYILPHKDIPSPKLVVVLSFTDGLSSSFDLIRSIQTIVISNNTGNFEEDDVITGISSGATARVVTWTDTPEFEIELISGQFVVGEEIHNGTHTAEVVSFEDNFKLRNGEAQYFDISYATRNYDALNVAKTIKSFIIRIESPDFADQSAQDHIVCIPYTPTGDNIKAIYYNNSYGGLDSIICTGDQQQSIETQNILSSKAEELGYEQGSSQITALNPSFINAEQAHTGNHPKGEIEALHDLLTLKSAVEYQMINGVELFIAIIPLGNGISFPSKKANMKSLSFSYRYAFEQKAIDRIA